MDLMKKFENVPLHEQLLLVSSVIFALEAAIFVYGLLGGPPGIYSILPWLIIWFFALMFSIFSSSVKRREKKKSRPGQ